MTRGGPRAGAGRKPGVKIKPATVVFYRRVTLDEYKFLDEQLEKFKEENKRKEKRGG